MKYYNDAIAKDPAYAPVYNDLYKYYYETNVAKSAEYLEKWLANSDDDPKIVITGINEICAGIIQEAITKADECIAAGGTNPYPNLYRFKGICL